jgi:hypothetical protein
MGGDLGTWPCCGVLWTFLGLRAIGSYGEVVTYDTIEAWLDVHCRLEDLKIQEFEILDIAFHGSLEWILETRSYPTCGRVESPVTVVILVRPSCVDDSLTSSVSHGLLERI